MKTENKYKNHKCKITIDINGNKIDESKQVIQEYSLIYINKYT